MNGDNYINSNYLGLRLVFHQVPATFSPARPELLNDPTRVPARLRFQEESPFCKWLQAEVVRRFAHPCCENVEQLRELTYGITREGLVKDGTRHIKDDHTAIGDRKNYVLGWTVQSKLAALMEEFEGLNQQVSDHDKKFKHAVEQLKLITTKLGAMELMLAIEDFDEINYVPLQERLNELHSEQEKLKKASNKVTELQRQLETVNGELAALTSSITSKDNAIGSVEGRREENTRKVNLLKREMQAVTVRFQEFAERILEFQADKSPTLDNIESVRHSVEKRLAEEKKAQQSQIDSAQKFLLPAMQRFMTAYPQERATLLADVSYGYEFVKLRDEIKGEELPKHQERFFSLLNTKLLQVMAAFNTKLSQDEKDIRDRIETVNRTLRHTKFSKDTYVHIRVTPSASQEISAFRARLRACLARGILPEKSELEQIYGHIRELIAEFEKEPEWTARVADVRNWMDYGVQELNEADGAEVEYYAMSSGKSGGQKTILAFNIMASAITSQYGLTGNGDDIDRFRLVLVDEAFAKTDPGNSQRTLELFKALGLQLLIINPWDAKSRIVENYVDTYHLANTDPERHISSLTRATRERYLEVRKLREIQEANANAN